LAKTINVVPAQITDNLNLLCIVKGKESLKSLKKVLKNRKSINIAPFNKDAAPEKKLKN
jgi:hypothetical protein